MASLSPLINWLATERKGTSFSPRGRQMTRRMRIFPFFLAGRWGARAVLGWARTKEWAERTRAASLFGSRSSSQGIVAASVTPVTISIRVSPSRSRTRLQTSRASSFV
ncbi:MAG TPA: hypothetical protein VLX28_17220 [Thermoanaerobaculia bacterium]|nr:hypothetical protein [Thermoanaerobaculia bacterium]